MEAYCMKCKTKREMMDPVASFNAKGSPVTIGVCSVCGTKLYRMEKTMHVSRRKLLVAAAGSALALAAGKNARAQPRKPNIVFIVADDFGYADASCYGPCIMCHMGRAGRGLSLPTQVSTKIVWRPLRMT